ncbi:hypothetical protein OKW23_001286 [Bacilli bacterium PM5-9]|nr:hypothetical protein [Bacilli bacterium PM5-9]
MKKIICLIMLIVCSGCFFNSDNTAKENNYDIKDADAAYLYTGYNKKSKILITKENEVKDEIVIKRGYANGLNNLQYNSELNNFYFTFVRHDKMESGLDEVAEVNASTKETTYIKFDDNDGIGDINDMLIADNKIYVIGGFGKLARYDLITKKKEYFSDKLSATNILCVYKDNIYTIVSDISNENDIYHLVELNFKTKKIKKIFSYSDENSIEDLCFLNNKIYFILSKFHWNKNDELIYDDAFLYNIDMKNNNTNFLKLKNKYAKEIINIDNYLYISHYDEDFFDKNAISMFNIKTKKLKSITTKESPIYIGAIKKDLISYEVKDYDNEGIYNIYNYKNLKKEGEYILNDDKNLFFRSFVEITK